MVAAVHMLLPSVPGKIVSVELEAREAEGRVEKAHRLLRSNI